MKVRFLNYATILGILFALIQQVIVAGSIIIISNLSQSIVTGSGFILWLCLFALSLTVVYIPTGLTNYFFNKAKYITYGDYINTFSGRAVGRVEHFLSGSFREKSESYFTHEAWMIIEEDYDYLKDTAHLVFNIVLSVSAFSYLISIDLLFAYASSIPLTVICVLFLKRIVEKQSDAAQTGKNRLMQLLGAGWDTILIGNKYNLSIWKRTFSKKCDDSSKAKRKLDLTLDLSAFVMVIICAAPVIVVIALTYIRAAGNISMLTLLIATTSKQLGTVQYLSDAISQFVNLSDKIRRTRQLSAYLSLDVQAASLGTITWNSITLQSRTGRISLNSIDDLRLGTNNYDIGRYTITGDNGSGKTTLLAMAKLALKEKAYFLPNKSKLFFESDLSQKEFSAGEKAIENLREILSHLHEDGVSVLLLDEWSANLDAKRVKSVNAIIEKIADEFCVIEVVHKHK